MYFTWLKDDSKELYLAALDQWTLDLSNKESLSQKGRKLYEAALSEYKKGNIKDMFIVYYLLPALSGPWSPDKTSRFHGKESFLADPLFGCLNSWRNVIIISVVADGRRIKTSPCIFIEKSWCLTKNGSIYKLGKLVDANEFDKVVETLDIQK